LARTDGSVAWVTCQSNGCSLSAADLDPGVTRKVVNTLHQAAGWVAVFEENPLKRRLRDSHTVAQQAQGRQRRFETAGRIMLGLAPENQF